MSSKEAKQTKTTLKENHENFKQLQNNAENLREQFQKKIIREISLLDQQEAKDSAKSTARKKALAFKGEIKDGYVQDERTPEEVPVDGELKLGTMVYMKNCSQCHSLEAVDGKPQKGPSLGLIYNRRVGSNMNFENYSMSMLKSSFFWSPLLLYKFMADANSIVPQTLCRLGRLPLTSESERADLITMFRQFTLEMSFNVRLKEIERVGYTSFQTTLRGEEEERTRGQTRDQRQHSFDKKI